MRIFVIGVGGGVNAEELKKIGGGIHYSYIFVHKKKILCALHLV